jgi:hypothetical protein
MAAISVNPPILVNSSGGFSIRIMEIDPDDTDLLHGELNTPKLGRMNKEWDRNGICRDTVPSANIAIDNFPELVDLLKRHNSY